MTFRVGKPKHPRDAHKTDAGKERQVLGLLRPVFMSDDSENNAESLSIQSLQKLSPRSAVRFFGDDSPELGQAFLFEL